MAILIADLTKESRKSAHIATNRRMQPLHVADRIAALWESVCCFCDA